jgi:hypothetical protein
MLHRQSRQVAADRAAPNAAASGCALIALWLLSHPWQAAVVPKGADPTAMSPRCVVALCADERSAPAPVRRPGAATLTSRSQRPRATAVMGVRG